MECPKCGLARDAEFAECPRCGIVIAKYVRAHAASHETTGWPASDPTGTAVLSAMPDAPATPDAHAIPAAESDSHERLLRAVAIPLALLPARFLVRTSPGMVRMITMWVHESGHAVMAWLCGFPAFPGPWATTVAPERSLFFTLGLVAALAVGGYRAWQLHRAFWVLAAGGTVLLLLFCTVRINHVNARQLITFGGDAGCFVLGTLMMLTVYAREDHPIRQNQIRWALLVIGALAFMDAYTVWSGPIDALPFGEDEHGISDPSVLTEMDGWNVLMLIRRYLGVAHACFAALAVVYVAMLFRSGRGSWLLDKAIAQFDVTRFPSRT